MASIKSSSSKGSSSSSSRLGSVSSQASNFSRQVKESTLELFINLNSVKRFWNDRWILLLLEMFSFFAFFLNTVKEIFMWNETTVGVGEYVFLLLDPTRVTNSFAGYLTVYLIASSVVFTGAGLVTYVAQKKTSNDLLCFLSAAFCRLTRTVFFYPLMYTFMSPMKCDLFGGTFVMNGFEEYTCTEFPFLLFWIVGVIMILITLGVCTVDSIFLMDKFKSISLYTAAADGRFTTFLFWIQVVSFILIQFFVSQDSTEAIIGSVALSIFLLAAALVCLIRFIPYFHFQFVCLIGTSLVIIVVTKMSLLVVLVTKQWWFLLLMTLIVIGIGLIWGVLCLRYFFLYRFFRKNKVRSNVFLCFFSIDIVIGIFVKEKISRLLSCVPNCLKRLRKNKIFPKSMHDHVNMMGIITDLLNNEDFEKTKNLCQLLATLTFGMNPQLTRIILTHTSTIMREDMMDVELSLEYYKLQTTNIQHSGNRKKKLKLVSELGRASKREDKLRNLIHMLFDLITESEDGTVSFSEFPNILTSIQVSSEFCESVYEKLVRTSPSSKTYHAYARYISKFKNDKTSSNMYIKEAKQLAYTQANHSDSEYSYHHHREVLQTYSGNLSNEEQSVVVPNNEERCEEESVNENVSDSDKSLSVFGETLPPTSFTPTTTLDDDDTFDDKHSEEQEEEGGESDESNNSDNSDYGILGEDEGIEESAKQSESEIDESNKGEEEVEIIPTSMDKYDDDRTQAFSADDDDDGISYTRKDSVITKNTNAFSTGSTQFHAHLAKKVLRGTYCSVWMIRFFCAAVFLVGVSVVILLFVMSFVLHDDFKGSADLVVMTSDLQMSVTNAAHFLRKLQISIYNSEDTPLGYERQPQVFDQLVLHHCEKVRDLTRELYKSMSVGQAAPWDDTELMLYEHVLSYDEDSKKNHYFVEDYTLLNGVSLYGEKCMKFRIDFPELSARYGSENYTVGNRIQDDESFIFVQLNEPAVYEGLEILKHHLLSYEEGDSFRLMMIYILVPCCLTLIFPLLCMVWCAFRIQQRKSFKGFFMIPKEQILDIREKLDQGTDSNWANGENQKRVDSTRCSLINRFCMLMCFTIVVLIFASLVFTLLGVLTCQKFVSRNREFGETLEVSVLTRRVHLWATELVYRDDSLFGAEEIVEGFDLGMLRLATVYDAIRTGAKDGYIPGNDKEEIPNKIYYDENCKTNRKYVHMFEYLSCLPLTQVIELVIENGEDLLRSNYTNKETRSDERYEMIIMLDSYNNGTLVNAGAVQDQLWDLEDYVAGKVDAYLSYIQSFSLLLLILFLPLFAAIYCLLFWSYPSRLNRNLTTVRRLMLLMNRGVLMRKEIYDYVSGKNSFKISFEKEQKNRIDIVCTSFHHSSYGMILFNSKLAIIRYNTTADELFNIKACGAHRFTDLFAEREFGKIKKFTSGKRKVLNTELMAKYDDQEYCVLADISRGDGMFCGIFENLESSKKKDLLKEAERLDDKTERLIQNILPMEIAKTMKIDDLLKGNCMISEHKKATAYFCDICDFTGLSLKMEVGEIIQMLHNFFSKIDDICDEYKLEKIKTIGDCYFAISGIPTYKPLHAKTGMDFAIAVLKMVNEMNKTIEQEDRKMYIRTGMSSGKLVAGIIGKRKFTYDTWGSMINEAARMEHHGYPGKIQVSRSTYEAIFNMYDFMERDVHLQGIGVSVKAYIHTPKFMDLDEISKKMETVKHRELIKAIRENRDVTTPQGDEMKNMDDEELLRRASLSGSLRLVSGFSPNKENMKKIMTEESIVSMKEEIKEEIKEELKKEEKKMKKEEEEEDESSINLSSPGTALGSCGKFLDIGDEIENEEKEGVVVVSILDHETSQNEVEQEQKEEEEEEEDDVFKNIKKMDQEEVENVGIVEVL